MADHVYLLSHLIAPEEAAAVANCLNFAESSNHARALCYVGHWYYHGEGGMAQSDRLALAFYEKAAEAGDASAAAARDKMYLAGKGGCEDAINHDTYVSSVFWHACITPAGKICERLKLCDYPNRVRNTPNHFFYPGRHEEAQFKK